MFFDDTDVEERQVAFDCLVKVIAKHKEMCCSSSLLNFLGFSLLADKEYFKVCSIILPQCDHLVSCDDYRQGESISRRKNREKKLKRRKKLPCLVEERT